jgi:hypothetical protein
MTMAFETENNHPPAPASSAFEDLMTLARLMADPKALQAGIDRYMAAGVKARDLEKAAERAVTAMKAREAELDKREERIASVEVETGLRRAEVNDRQARLHQILAEIRQEGDRFKRELLRYAGVADHFNERLQTLPDWDALARAVLGQSDVHFDEAAPLDRGDVSGEVEPVPHAVAGSTLTRSRESTAAERRSMRRVDH